MREKERKGRGASVRQRTRLSLATPMIHRIYSQTVCQTIGQEFGETRTSVIGAQAQKEIRTSERYVHYWVASEGLGHSIAPMCLPCVLCLLAALRA